MDTNKLIVDITRLFWEMNSYDKFSDCEMRLLFYILEMAVKRQDINDIPFSATCVSGMFHVNRKTLIIALGRLIARGLLRCTKRDARGGCRTVSLVNPENLNSQQNSSINIINKENIKEKNKDNFNNLKEKNIKKEGKVKKEAEAEKELDELGKILRADGRWHKAMQASLAKERPMETEEVAQLVDEFISNQQSIGRRTRIESDLRSHCFNWIRYRLRNPQSPQTNKVNNINNINIQENGNNPTYKQLSALKYHPRRGAEVRATTPAEYKTWF